MMSPRIITAAPMMEGIVKLSPSQMIAMGMAKTGFKYEKSEASLISTVF